MRILVTGGAGYIGSVTVAALAEGGHDVVVYDSMEKGHRAAVHRGARLVEGNLADADRVAEAFRAHRPEAVIHFAAYSLVGESVEDPARYFANNVANGIVLLEAMRREGVGRIVFSSSAAVYGAPRRMPIGEDDPAEPVNPYGESKLFLERILRRYREAYGLDWISLRYFNAAGASGEHGEDHDPETHLIPLVLAAAAGRAPSVKVFGSDYPTPDGTCVRDYVDVRDLADAHILALGCRGGRVYNLGNGRGFSVREVLEAARSVTGKSIAEEAAPRRPGDPPVLIAGSERIRRELGWEPRRAGLEEIIGSAWEWMRRHPGGYGA